MVDKTKLMALVTGAAGEIYRAERYLWGDNPDPVVAQAAAQLAQAKALLVLVELEMFKSNL
ncbi:MAG: hypothetical protein ACRD3I_07455 [Terriglobales bacterium]